MDDCRETRERISMTFRPGAVDLPQDQVRASRGAITFEAPGFDVDMFDWGFDVPAPETRGLHTAPLTQTNLRGREYGAFNFGRPKLASIYGGSSRAGSTDESTQHLDSQDFQPIDLDLGLEDMEMGRDAFSERSRSKSLLNTPSVVNAEMELDAPFDAGGDTFEPLDLGLDLGDLPDLEPEPPVEEGPEGQQVQEERARRSSSELSTPPPETLDLTPRVAKRVADAKAAPRAKRVRIVRADEELELPDEDFAPPADDSPILGEENFIPANPAALRLRDILADPVAHFLPTSNARLFAGPPGLAPELAELFTFPANVLRRVREEPSTPPARPAKRPRKATSEAPEEPAESRAGTRGSPASPTLTRSSPCSTSTRALSQTSSAAARRASPRSPPSRAPTRRPSRTGRTPSRHSTRAPSAARRRRRPSQRRPAASAATRRSRWACSAASSTPSRRRTSA
jgi:cohesin complex subunit SCC1